MKRIKIRKDLKSKSAYAKSEKLSRTTIDAMIDRGDLEVEEISGKHYIKVV